MKAKFKLSDYIHHDALIIIRNAEQSTEWERGILAILPFDCDLYENEDFERAVNDCARSIAATYTFEPSDYITVTVIINNSHVNI